ncbi:hypothetical protein B0T37_10340 [Chromobacterium violaceum]|uniref:hypothetical protein n=1 Tax=Chromobacterium violaceum TaxID=536 RepID=UPI0009DA4F5D|nr:hypothetical protein [Chromobacterium violaceum]OQS10039.1 hypothetical protein B0T38_10735 [Chromobacterium violaceum]OQS26454.1 hypothetical protein B0T37_10340 [Chromobacterium violaceum]
MIDIDAIIDSMGWSLDADERADMRRLCRAALIIAAERSGGMAAEVKEIDGVLHVFWSKPVTDGMKLFTHQQSGPVAPDTTVTWSELRHELGLFCFGLSRNERAPSMEPDAFECAIDAMVDGGDCALSRVRTLLSIAPSPN